MATVVIGASGFVGSLVCAALQADGHVVRTISAPRIVHDGPVNIEEITKEYETEIRRLAEDLEGAKAVVNAAGISDAAANESADLIGANAILPAIVALACRHARVGRFIHVSSAAVQGRRALLDESTSTDPTSPYSRSKAEGERLVLEVAPHAATVYRPAGVHGSARQVTRSLARFASSPFCVIPDGPERPTPQALGENVGSAIAFMATCAAPPPRVVLHPYEGLTTGSLLELLGGRPPKRIPAPATRAALGLARLLEPLHGSIPATTRRAEMLWLGQSQAISWLTAAGWTNPVGMDGWRKLGTAARSHGGSGGAAKRPAILFGITTGLSAQSFFEGQFEMLRDAGWDVILTTTDEGSARRLAENEGATFVPLSAAREPSPLQDLITLARLIAMLRRLQPAHAVWGSPKLGLLGPLASRVTRTSNTYVLHGMRLETAKPPTRWALAILERIACRASQNVIAVSHDLRRQAVRKRVVAPSKIKVLGRGSANGIGEPVNVVGAKARLGISEASLVAVFVGRITRDKGLHELLQAWQEVHLRSEAILLLAGFREKDANEGRLNQLLRDTPGVVELGHLDDLSTLYSAADVLLLPSYREGLPTVVLEAASYGVPAVVTDATGVRESVVPYETGLVVPLGDIAALTDAILTIFSDGQLRARLGTSAAAWVTGFSRGAVHRAWRQYYDQWKEEPGP